MPISEMKPNDHGSDRFPLLTLSQTFWMLVIVTVVFLTLNLGLHNLWSWIGSVRNNQEFRWGLPPTAAYGWSGAIALLIIAGVAGSNTQQLWLIDGGWSPRVLARAMVGALALVSGVLIALGLLLNRFA